MEGATMYDALITSLTAAFTTTQVLGIIGQVVTAGATFVLAWFGARKLVYGVQRALKGGKLKI